AMAFVGRTRAHPHKCQKDLAKSLQCRPRHVNAARRSKPAVFPEHHLTESSVDVDANHPSHSHLLPSKMTGAAADTTTTDSRSRRNRASRRGGQLTTRALGSSYGSACPHLRAPGASVPMVAPYATTPRIAAEHWHRGSHTG